MKEDKVGSASNTHGGDEKFVQYLGWKTWKEQPTLKTSA